MKVRISWPRLIILSIIFVLFVLTALPATNNYLVKETGEFRAPDTSLIYSPEDLYQMAKNYGLAGRDAYIQLRWTFDIIWPILYTLFLVLWTKKLLEYRPNNKITKYLFVVPLVGMTFDFLENIGATIVMFRYPLGSGLIAGITPLMTFLKWFTLGGSFLTIIILLIKIAFGKINKISKYKN